jgi:hypothetical protein
MRKAPCFAAKISCWAFTLPLALAVRPAAAKCPNEAPEEPACEPISSIGMPAFGAVGYFPRKDLDPYWGGGVEIAGFSWSNNNDAFGPSQGTLRLGAAYLRAVNGREMVYYRFGWIVSFEGNASRRFLIPYFGGGLGALWETELGSRALAEASLGVYLFYGRGLVVDAGGTAVLPFTAVDRLLAPKAQITASFALW